MAWEKGVLLSIHAAAHPFLDALFLFSHQVGTIQFGIVLVLLMTLWHAARRDRRAALVWLVVGVLTALLQSQLKSFFGRPRPELWPRLIQPVGEAWPSGHALSTATFFPLLAWHAAARWPRRAVLAWSVAAALVLYVGVGRLYLGVHWPTDVLGGWLIALPQVLVAVRLMRRAVP